jgi:hypothetical protein
MNGYQDHHDISPVKLDRPAGVVQQLKINPTNDFNGVPRLMRGQYTNPTSPNLDNPYADLDSIDIKPSRQKGARHLHSQSMILDS